MPVDLKRSRHGADTEELLKRAIEYLLSQARQDHVALDLSGIEIPAEANLKLHTFGPIPGLTLKRGTVDIVDVFAGCKFEGDVVIHTVPFRTGVSFCGADFGGTLEIAGLDPSANVCDFSDCIFRGLTKISMQHASTINFARARFLKGATLSHIAAPIVSLQEADFAEGLSFEAMISDKLDADDIACHRRAKISVHMNRGNGVATFRRASFDDLADFRRSAFEGDVDCDAMYLADQARFDAVRFGRHASFRHCTFRGRASFIGGDPSSPALQGNEFHDVTFRGAQFAGPADFTNRHLVANGDFENCRFAFAPEFHGAAIHQAVLLPYEDAFADTRSPNAAQAYRTLKLAMETTRARREEAMFYALEQRSLRNKSGEMNFWERTISASYDGIARYGQSSFRPLLILVISCVLFALGYAWWASAPLAIDSNVDWSLIKRSIGFSLEQVVNPFGVWRVAPRYFAHSGINGHILRLQIVATVQSLISAALATLFLLAIRWRFKRD